MPLRDTGTALGTDAPAKRTHPVVNHARKLMGAGDERRILEAATPGDITAFDTH